ncbi:FliA/WhiG family RNA polymerase sigma factor [Nitrospinota bacterium]
MSPDKDFDPTDRDALILNYTPLIKFIANRLAIRLPPHIDVNDLISSGVLGLIDAIEKYDPSREAQFKTYAEFRVRGAMLDELRSLDWIPRSVRQKSNRIENAFARIEQELGRPASDDEVAESLGMNIEEFQDMVSRSAGLAILSLDDIIDRNRQGESGRTLLDTLSGLDEDDPQAQHAFAELKQLLAQAIDALPERERLVLSLYYHEEMSMKEIGAVMEVTESRVSQIHSKAISRIRGRMRRMVGERN